MKTKKLSLDKMTITKLKKPEMILGGGGGETATNKTQKKSGLICKKK